MLHNEDRELQIRLAELQADVQIGLTLGLGFLAGFIALLIAFGQLLPAVPQEQIIMRFLVLVVMLIIVTSAGVGCPLFILKAFNARKRMAELRKRYVW